MSTNEMTEDEGLDLAYSYAQLDLEIGRACMSAHCMGIAEENFLKVVTTIFRESKKGVLDMRARILRANNVKADGT